MNQLVKYLLIDTLAKPLLKTGAAIITQKLEARANNPAQPKEAINMEQALHQALVNTAFYNTMAYELLQEILVSHPDTHPSEAGSKVMIDIQALYEISMVLTGDQTTLDNIQARHEARQSYNMMHNKTE